MLYYTSNWKAYKKNNSTFLNTKFIIYSIEKSIRFDNEIHYIYLTT